MRTIKYDPRVSGMKGCPGDVVVYEDVAGACTALMRQNGDRFAWAIHTPGTATNVTQLSFAVTANRHYVFRFMLLVQSNTATVGVAATVTIPTATRFGATMSTIFAADGSAAAFVGAISSSGDAVIPTAVPAINTDYLMVVEGVLIPSANGTLQLQVRTETGTTNVVVRQGSIGYLTDHGV